MVLFVTSFGVNAEWKMNNPNIDTDESYIYNTETLEIYFCNPSNGICRQMVFTDKDTNKYFWSKDNTNTK